MGLDMYAYSVQAEAAVTVPVKEILPVDFEVPDSDKVVNIATWRKHPNLHGWMEELYYRKGGQAESFNCVNVALTMADIEQLEEDVLNDQLPHTAGFFFGASSPEDKEDDLKFIKKAKEELEKGNLVYYTSWW